MEGYLEPSSQDVTFSRLPRPKPEIQTSHTVLDLQWKVLQMGQVNRQGSDDVRLAQW